nr:hypothetical protein [Chloroflexia bacterium]
QPDPRAAWATWPQVLRLLEEQSFPAGANPIASLHARLTKDTPIIGPPATGPSREIDLAAAHLVVHPSYAAFHANAADDETT